MPAPEEHVTNPRRARQARSSALKPQRLAQRAPVLHLYVPRLRRLAPIRNGHEDFNPLSAFCCFVAAIVCFVGGLDFTLDWLTFFVLALLGMGFVQRLQGVVWSEAVTGVIAGMLIVVTFIAAAECERYRPIEAVRADIDGIHVGFGPAVHG